MRRGAVLYIPPEMRQALEAQQDPKDTRTIDEKASAWVIRFLEENLTEERSDVIIEKVKEIANAKVPRLLRPVVSLAFSVADRFIPEALIRGVDAGLKEARERFFR